MQLHAEWKEVRAVCALENIIAFGLRVWVTDLLRDLPEVNLRRDVPAWAAEHTCWQRQHLSVFR